MPEVITDTVPEDTVPEDMQPDQGPAESSTADIEHAKSTLPQTSDFTNCGKPQAQKPSIKRAKKKLTRVPFTVSRLMEFCTRRELVNQTGHDELEWPLVVAKEVTDNAIDEAEEAGFAPVVHIEVTGNKIIISDNGRGIPAKPSKGFSTTASASHRGKPMHHRPVVRRATH